MRTIIFLTIFSFLLLWIGLAAFLTGYIPAEYLPENFRQLTLPKSTTDLGDSLAILDGVFTSIAMVLGLIAILLQGKELKESTKAQTEQAHSLSIQINQQNSSNILGAYAARLQFLLTEVERLEEQIDKLLKEVKTEKIDEKKNEKWQIIKNSRDLQINYRDQTKEIDNKIQELLNSI
jgi:hypothetical protein